MNPLPTREIQRKVTPYIKMARLASTPLPIIQLLLLFMTSGGNCWAAAQLIERINFEQPDGTAIELRGHGNEYHAVYETLDGYTVVFVPESRAYFYAVRSESGEELVSSGLQVGQGDPREFGLERDVQIEANAAREQASRSRREWEERMRLPERWAKLKETASQPPEFRSMGLRYRNTIGTKVGLTLLIDFDATPGTIAKSNIVAFLNGDNYRGNGNRGSVKEYFRDVSDGKLIYTNVVLGYIRIPASLRPRTFYDDLNRLTFETSNELIRDAIHVLTNQPNYLTEIVPQFEALSVNERDEVLALNVFIAGNRSGVWARGLWPNSGSLQGLVGPQELWPGGKKVNFYQMTTMENLGLHTFCHETGHLVCDFPDIYDYDSQSAGGAGQYCIMGSGPAGALNTNPQHPCAYLKVVAGWATVTDILPGAAGTFTLNATNGNHFLRYRDPRNPWSQEYFLIENRQKTGRDAALPGAGVLVWHIDELGNNSNENLLPNSIHANYEITLMQADGRWDLHRFQNAGDATDPFYSGNSAARYANRFADDTIPSAHWWDGNRSGLELRDFSVRSNLMTLTAEVKPPRIRRDPISQAVNIGDDLFLSIQMAAEELYTFDWFKAGVPVSSSERIAGANGPSLAVYGVTRDDAGPYTVVVTDLAGRSETSRVAQVIVSSLRSLASADLGDASRMPGTTMILNNTFQISAGGSGLVGGADGCRFLYERITGDFDAKVQIVDMNVEQDLNTSDGPSEPSGGVGLMVRAGLEPHSSQAAVLIRPRFLEGEIEALSRATQAAETKQLTRISGIPSRNNWVRLRREGTLISLYYSTNGTRWDWMETLPLPLNSDALLGIAASSYNPVARVVRGVSSFAVQSNTPPTFAISTLKSSTQEGTDEKAILEIVSSRMGPLEAPYTIANASANGALYETLAGRVSFQSGTNVAYIEITPINNATAGPPHVLTLTVQNSGVIQSSASAILFDDEERGFGLKKESFSGIPGTKVSDLTRHYRFPGSVQLATVPAFESTISQEGGQILSGYITPPASGPYTFYLVSANASELWLSPDAIPQNAIKVAEELGNNTRRNWAGFDVGPKSHISSPIPLTQGRWYFVRAIHKAGRGSAYLGVAWQLPGGDAPAAGSAPISGEYLSWTLPGTNTERSGTLRITRASTGQLLLTVESGFQMTFTLEASNDLINWQAISTNIPIREGDLLSLDNLGSTQTRRFYRVFGR